MQCEEIAATDGGSGAKPRTRPARGGDVHQYLGRVAADKAEVRRQHGDDTMVEQLIAHVRLYNKHGTHFRTGCIAERVVHHDHVATPVDHGLVLSCQSSGSSSARSGYM